jgi:hypothetical protein
MQDTLEAFKKSQASFDQYYSTHLAPQLKAMEQKWQRQMLLVYLLGIWGFVALSAAITLNQVSGLDQNGLSLISFLVGLALLISAVLVYAALYDQYKQVLIGGVCTYLGFNYQRKNFTFPLDEFDDLLPFYRSVKLQDRISGKHNGVGFELCKGKFTRKQGDKSKSFYRLLISFDFPQSFLGETVITPDEGRLPARLLERLRQKGEPIELGAVEFDKQFEVYTTDKLAVRQLLTPQFIEKLMDLAKRLGGTKGLTLAFAGNKIRLSVFQTRESRKFEIGHLFKSPIGRQYAPSIFEDLFLISTIIETLGSSPSTSDPGLDTPVPTSVR